MDWATADNHFHHTKVIRFCERPFADVTVMNECMISNWNEVVDEKDTVWHSGDFSLGTIEQVIPIFWRLKGKIHVLGYPWHHDKRWLKKAGQLPPHVVIEPPMVVLKREVPIVMCHYPFEEWDRKHYGAIHLHGHSHGRLPKVERRVDVGVDCWNFYPVSLEEILETVK